MKTERQIWRRGRHWLMAVGVLLLGGSAFLSCSEYDLDERTPDFPGGGNLSIYGWLSEQGNYTNVVRLIDDLGYREVLATTGSMTLFVADDAAYERFFQNNAWGVKSYGELSTAQKRQLLFGSMINSSYQVADLSSTKDRKEGNSMRRLSSLSIYDNVQVMKKEEIPDAVYWQLYRDRDELVVMHDMSVRPIIHFIERYMTNKQITNDDYDFLYNYTTNRQSGEASVNNAQIVEQNIRCLNGFINRMSEVVTPLPNMADIIASKPSTTQFAHLLQRYAVLDYCGDEVTRLYNENRGTNVDSVFQLRYFSTRSQDGLEFSETHNQNSDAQGKLPFDPGWNSYYIPSSGDAEIALQEDMAVMLVPSDEALTEFWENGAGAALRNNFGSWDNVPYTTLTEFIKANMLSSFASSVPSKFNFILNDAADPLGIRKEHVDSVWLGCNGAVYLTNHVFTPTSFVSVMYPTVVDQNMSIMHWAIEKMKYSAYLNSLNSRYSFFLPSNNALLEYIDPASYGKPQLQVLRFHYDGNRKGKEVYASVHNIDPETGVVGDSIREYTYNSDNLKGDPILNRLYEILDDHVIIGDVEDGHEYYRTKGGSTLRVRNVSQGANGMIVEGSGQVNGEFPSLPISYIYDQTNGGNGKTYIMESGTIQGTRQTVFNILEQHPEFNRFRELLEGSDLCETSRTIGKTSHACYGTCISVFDSFHYTVYVPTNESIDKLIADGKLPTWEDVDKLDPENPAEKALADKYTQQINEFLRYHIQDNSLFIGANNITATDDQSAVGDVVTEYETAFIDKATKRFNKLSVTTDQSGSSLTIKDKAGHTRRVMTDKPGLFNLMAREYIYTGTDRNDPNNNIYSSSSAVIHLIDEPLLIED